MKRLQFEKHPAFERTNKRIEWMKERKNERKERPNEWNKENKLNEKQKRECTTNFCEINHSISIILYYGQVFATFANMYGLNVTLLSQVANTTNARRMFLATINC